MSVMSKKMKSMVSVLHSKGEREKLHIQQTNDPFWKNIKRITQEIENILLIKLHGMEELKKNINSVNKQKHDHTDLQTNRGSKGS